MLVVNESALGHDESAWRHLARVPELAPLDARRVLVVAPHPDDETLAVGGLLHALHERCQVTVVAVTNGEGSHPRSTTTTPDEMAERRIHEQREALAELGVSVMYRLGLPDGWVVSHERALAKTLKRLFRGASVCIAPYEKDGHPDHDATGRAAIAACAGAGVRLLRYPVWAFHDQAPTDAIWKRARRISLDGAARMAKARALSRFRSQFEPLSPLPGDERILPPSVLDRFRRPYEVVFE